MLPDTDNIDCECGASHWRFTGAQKLSNPSLHEIQCLECGRTVHVSGSQMEQPRPTVNAAIPAAERPFHLKLRWYRAVHPNRAGELSPGGEVRLCDGVKVVFDHIVAQLSKARSDCLFMAQHLTDFIVLADLHGVTVEVEEWLDGQILEPSYKHRRVTL